MPITRHDTDDGRYYTDHEGNKYLSVTTLLSDGIPKKNLMSWYGAEASHAVMRELVPSLVATKHLLNDLNVSQMSETNKDVLGRLEKAAQGFDHKTAKADQRTMLQMLTSEVKSVTEAGRRRISGAANRARDEAASAGSKAHDLIEKMIIAGDGKQIWDKSGEPDSDKVNAILEQYNEFVKEHEPQYEAAEATVYSKTHSYAGTLDWIAKLPMMYGDNLVIGDTKTGRGVYPEVALQLAAYKYAEVLESVRAGGDVEMPETQHAVVLHLRPDLWEVVEVDVGKEQFQMFQYAMQIAWFTRGLGDNWIGEHTFDGARERLVIPRGGLQEGQ